MICNNKFTYPKSSRSIEDGRRKYLFNDANLLFEYLQNKSIFSNILFSPGFPSGLDYKNFEERGDEFNKLIHKLEK